MAVVPRPTPEPLPQVPGARPVRPRTRRFWWVSGSLVFVILLGSWWLGQRSQSPYDPAPAAFCKATARYEKAIDRQAAVQKVDVDEQVELVEAIETAALAPGRRQVPRSVRDDVVTFADAMRAVQADPKTATPARVQAAVDRVNRYSSQACGTFERQGL